MERPLQLDFAVKQDKQKNNPDNLTSFKKLQIILDITQNGVWLVAAIQRHNQQWTEIVQAVEGRTTKTKVNAMANQDRGKYHT